MPVAVYNTLHANNKKKETMNETQCSIKKMRNSIKRAPPNSHSHHG